MGWTRRVPFLLTMLLAACASDPVQPPDVPQTAQYTPTPVADETVSASVHGGNAQRFVTGSVPEQWWTLFQSPALDGLVRTALDNSPTLEQARAKLRQAQADREAKGSARYPKVDAQLSANRVDIDAEALGSGPLPVEFPLDLFFASVGVSYHFDLFGAVRHELQAHEAIIDYQRYELEATQLALTGNVVTAAIREASLREQIAIAEEITSNQEKRLDIVERLEQLGTASQGDVIAQRLELAQTRALLPQLQVQLDQVRHQLAVYVGQAPGNAQLPQFRLADLQLPAQLPVSLPSELARRRPDIRAAEALLRQAGARVGVATAHLYPQIVLSATAGSLSTHASDLFGHGSAFYLLGASLTQPIFRGGELRAKRRSAIAAYEQAGAAYRQVVLQGFQDVADVLRALDADARKLHEHTAAAEHARRYQEITAARYEAGGVSYYTLLDTQRSLQTALFDMTQSVADRYADSAALFQALGGGW